ncbi:MAG: flagellar assembly protein FliW [Armatimonadota bacterium]
MVVTSTRFGRMEVDPETLLTMPEGLLGFTAVTRYCFLKHGEDSPFYWLQAVDDPDLAFVVVNPFDFFPEYDFEISDADAGKLNLQNLNNIRVLSIVTIDEDTVTTNLAGPIILNMTTRLARQIVLPEYRTRHPLIPPQPSQETDRASLQVSA